jgi:DNA-binding transcriptional LysR family regulator
MDFRELQYVVTVAECQNITQAARKLYISQPSLSYSLGQIEKEVGVKLFDRSHQPLTLTEAGRIYVRTAQSILREKTDMKNRIADLKEGASGDVTLGIPSGRAGYMLPPIMNAFRKKYPESEVFLQEAGTEQLMELLKSHKVSFIICPWPAEDQPFQIRKELIYEEEIPLFAGPGAFRDNQYADKEKRMVDLKKISMMPFISIKRRHLIHRMVDSIFQEAGINPNLYMEVDSSYDAVLLASCGLGYTFAPARTKLILGSQAASFCYRYTPEMPCYSIYVMALEGHYLNKAERCFIDLMKQHFSPR